MARHPRAKTCAHPVASLRSTIGPESGILCGLCGQDIHAATIFAVMLDEIVTQKRTNDAMFRFLISRTGGDVCQQCGCVDDVRKIFHGLKTQGFRSVCADCLERWFDNEDGFLDDMSVPYLARYLLLLGAGVANGIRESLARKAHEAFPSELAAELSRQSR